MCEITKMKTHIVIHIEKRRKMQEIKLYTILSTLSTDEKTESCGIRNVQNKQLFCEVITAIQFFVKLSQQSSFCVSLKRNIIVRKKRQLFKMLRKYCLGRGLMV